MKFLAITILLAATAVALPSGSGSSPKANDITLRAAKDKCGSNTKLSCCNKKIESGDSYEKKKGLLTGGVLNGLLGGSKGGQGLGVFDQCSELSVTALVGLDDLLGDKCSQNIACCDDSESDASGGLVNVALPCVALQGLL